MLCKRLLECFIIIIFFFFPSSAGPDCNNIDKMPVLSYVVVDRHGEYTFTLEPEWYMIHSQSNRHVCKEGFMGKFCFSCGSVCIFGVVYYYFVCLLLLFFFDCHTLARFHSFSLLLLFHARIGRSQAARSPLDSGRPLHEEVLHYLPPRWR